MDASVNKIVIDRAERLTQWAERSFKNLSAAATACGMSAQQFSKYTGGLREPGTPVLERMASAGLDVTWYLTGKAPAADTNDPNALLDLEVIPLGELVTAAMRMNERQGELLERIRQATA